jgi:peptidoglycan hydrolase-like protein with peptidoglycan-binding domain
VAQYEDTVSPFPISGNYDAATEEAVRGFQRTYGIEPTGIVDENTYARLFDVYSAIILSLPDSLFTETARPYPGFRISRGFDGDYVSDLQRYLGAIATVFPTVIAPAVTGVYDEATENAVKEVQRLSSLEVTGVTDLLTWSAIGELYNDVRSGEITSPEQYPGYILGGDNNGI